VLFFGLKYCLETGKPLAINFSESETTAVIVLAESNMAKDHDWNIWLHELSAETVNAGLGTHIFPVAIEHEGLSTGLEEQAVRWDLWLQEDSNDVASMQLRLISTLTYEFCRMLRHYLEHLKQPDKSDDELLQYLRKVQIFLSHSKHDSDGERIAYLIRDQLHKGMGLAHFLMSMTSQSGFVLMKYCLSKLRKVLSSLFTLTLILHVSGVGEKLLKLSVTAYH
jgi:hypothetical protein